MQTFVRSDRDLRIDFFRGIALWSMYIDHLIRGSLQAITFRQYGFCDSAELFVLLSGISAGMVYGRTAERKGVGAGRAKIFARAFVLYRTHLIMLFLYLAEAGLLLARLHPPAFLHFYGLESFSTQPYRDLLDGVTLRFEPENMDILPLYIVLLLLLWAVLPQILRRPRVVLSLSAGLYLATRWFDLSIPGWPGFFNPLAWQLLFVTGAVSGRILKGERSWGRWDVAAAGFAMFALIESHAHFLSRYISPALLLHTGVDKAGLHPLRLVSILSLSWLAWRFLPASAAWLRSRWAMPFVLLGQHSLPVFVASIFLAMAGEAWFTIHAGWLSQVVVQGAGSAVMLAVAAWFSWNAHSGARVPAVAPRAETAGSIA